MNPEQRKQLQDLADALIEEERAARAQTRYNPSWPEFLAVTPEALHLDPLEDVIEHTRPRRG